MTGGRVGDDGELRRSGAGGVGGGHVGGQGWGVCDGAEFADVDSCGGGSMVSAVKGTRGAGGIVREDGEWTLSDEELSEGDEKKRTRTLDFVHLEARPKEGKSP